MEKSKLYVPKGVRYISEWKEFKLFDFPHILNKQIPGCGFTEFCINCDSDVILCSPRRILLENKHDQHMEDVLYISNASDDILNIDKDLSRLVLTKRDSSVRDDNISDGSDDGDQGDITSPGIYNSVYESISSYVEERERKSLPLKILVTYDSFGLVKDAVSNLGILYRFHIIVDEFQSIFIDSKFKSTTEISFLRELQGIQNLCYVSATPMIDKYLKALNEFRDLPYYELDWEKEQPGRVARPNLTIRSSVSVFTTAKEIIKKYKDGNFATKYIQNGDGNVEVVESREAVIYVNSVNNIISIIRKAELEPEEVNILCANTPENRSRLRKKLGKRFSLGRIPLRGEQHKMFTFCTRTVYLGADFYSTNARTFIISDANIDSLAVDISLDLPQILGRQRLDCNPWKNEANFYYRSTVKSKQISKEKFDSIIHDKLEESKKLIGGYEQIVDEEYRKSNIRVYEVYAKVNNYRDDYVAIDSKKMDDGRFIKYPTINKLVLISEQRAFDIQQIDYADRFSVFSTASTVISGEKVQEVAQIMERYERLPRLYDKLKFLCNLSCGQDVFQSLLDNITENHFKEFITILGRDRCKSLGYDITRIKRELSIRSFGEKGSRELEEVIYQRFIVGSRYPLSEVKKTLKKIYTELGFQKTAKANDIEDFFNAKYVYTTDEETGKRIVNYELLSRLD